jgi:hypothetical protein
MMNFQLNDKEEKAAKKFIKKQLKKNKDQMGAIGGRFAYKFIVTGVGTAVIIVDGLLEEEKNITDYGCW